MYLQSQPVRQYTTSKSHYTEVVSHLYKTAPGTDRTHTWVITTKSSFWSVLFSFKITFIWKVFQSSRLSPIRFFQLSILPVLHFSFAFQVSNFQAIHFTFALKIISAFSINMHFLQEIHFFTLLYHIPILWHICGC